MSVKTDMGGVAPVAKDFRPLRNALPKVPELAHMGDPGSGLSQGLSLISVRRGGEGRQRKAQDGPDGLRRRNDRTSAT